MQPVIIVTCRWFVSFGNGLSTISKCDVIYAWYNSDAFWQICRCNTNAILDFVQFPRYHEILLEQRHKSHSKCVTVKEIHKSNLGDDHWRFIKGYVMQRVNWERGIVLWLALEWQACEKAYVSEQEVFFCPQSACTCHLLKDTVWACMYKSQKLTMLVYSHTHKHTMASMNHCLCPIPHKVMFIQIYLSLEL